jgi:hypothetical protein
MVIYGGVHRAVFLDIETEGVRMDEEYMPEFTAPVNYKDPDKVLAYVEKKREDFLRGLALDLDHARIRAIGLAKGLKSEPKAYLVSDDASEKEALEFFWFQASGRMLSGYNIRGFDLPILLRRSWDLRVPVGIPIDTGRYSRSVYDIMQVLYHEGYGPGPRYRGLKEVCRLYGIPNPLPDMDGSKVKDMDDEMLEKYVANDVRMVQRLAAKMRGWYW